MGNDHLGEKVCEAQVKFLEDGAPWTDVRENETLSNAPSELIRSNIEANIIACPALLEVAPAHGKKAIMCGGGPSLAKSIGDIYATDGQIFALNNVPGFLWKSCIWSDFQVVLDANPHTLEFDYGHSRIQLIASQCDVGVIPKCYNPRLWHADSPETQDLGGLIIGGGLSVGLYALCVAYALGYRELHLYGYDSSHAETKHVYAQALNDAEPVIEVMAAGRKFKTSTALAHQAFSFQQVAANLAGLGCDIHVHGEGLLPHLAWVWTHQAARSQQEILQ
jgi:uncharacterized Rossmann fold enzyme